MRFVLDQNVDNAVRQMLLDHHHECWTAFEAGLGTEDDDNLATYATDKQAVLISHDHEFSIRRRRNTVGQHIYLDCSEFDAAQALRLRLTEVERILRAVDHAVITLTVTGLLLHVGWQ